MNSPETGRPLRRRLLLCLPVLLILQRRETACAAAVAADDKKKPRRIAIVGGGVGGTFFAKYLTDYDAGCDVDAIDVFEPSPLSAANTPVGTSVTDTTADADAVAAAQDASKAWQGSRISSLTLSDGTIVELGASIIYDGNKLAVDMMKGDTTLVAGTPFFPGEAKARHEEGKPQRKGFGIFDGNGRWLLDSTAANLPSLVGKLALLWRYNIDLFRISSAASSAIQSFDLIYELLDSTRTAAFLDSPDEIWDSVGLRKVAAVSYDDFLDAIGVCREGVQQWWRSFLPYQGCIRTELLSAATINNYNQETSRMNGLSGLVSFIPTKGKLFTIEGGNYQLIMSALMQARKNRADSCKENDSSRNGEVNHIRKKVTHIVGDLESGAELFAGEESLGKYDIVVLAAPLQHCGISFFVRSHFDAAILQPMPMPLINSDEEDADTHQHMAPVLPSSARRPYTQVVATVVSGGRLRSAFFNSTGDDFPRSILFSEKGRELENVFTVTHLTSDGVFKLFSQTELSGENLDGIFHPGYKVEYVKVWGGEYGGATPDFDGGGESSVSTPFLLYDGGALTAGHGYGPALYYVNAMEASVAAIEISAIGAKAVAKLCAKRLELIPSTPNSRGDEL